MSANKEVCGETWCEHGYLISIDGQPTDEGKNCNYCVIAAIDAERGGEG